MQLAEETAIVSFIEGDYAFLETGRGVASCNKCSARSSCASVTLVKRSESHLRIKNSLNLKAGDTVILGLSTDKLLFGTVLIYLLPLFALFVCAAVGKHLGGELYSAIAGICGLFVSLFLIRKFVKQKKVIKQFTPHIIHTVDFKVS